MSSTDNSTDFSYPSTDSPNTSAPTPPPADPATTDTPAQAPGSNTFVMNNSDPSAVQTATDPADVELPAASTDTANSMEKPADLDAQLSVISGPPIDDVVKPSEGSAPPTVGGSEKSESKPQEESSPLKSLAQRLSILKKELVEETPNDSEAVPSAPEVSVADDKPLQPASGAPELLPEDPATQTSENIAPLEDSSSPTPELSQTGPMPDLNNSSAAPAAVVELLPPEQEMVQSDSVSTDATASDLLPPSDDSLPATDLPELLPAADDPSPAEGAGDLEKLAAQLPSLDDTNPIVSEESVAPPMDPLSSVDMGSGGEVVNETPSAESSVPELPEQVQVDTAVPTLDPLPETPEASPLDESLSTPPAADAVEEFTVPTIDPLPELPANDTVQASMDQPVTESSLEGNIQLDDSLTEATAVPATIDPMQNQADTIAPADPTAAPTNDEAESGASASTNTTSTGSYAYSIGQLLDIVVERNASDLHITVGYPAMIRVDSELISVVDDIVNEEQANELILAVLPEQKKELLEVNREVDLAHEHKEGARFRINAYYQKETLAAAFRLIPNEIKNIDQLQLPAVYHSLAKLKQGLVLVTGPTGSGKSTTLAAIIQEINETRPDHIITIEDPIEYVFPKARAMVDQRELHEDTHSWEIAMKSALRQDPDVVLVGEMRDYETISAAITLAETGHLVFATLHTNSAAQTIDRIIDVFPEHQQAQVRSQLSNTIEAVVAQRLIPIEAGGRRAVSEIMIATPAVRNLIREAKTHQIDNVIRTSADIGMVSLEHTLVKLVRENVITMEKAQEYAVHPEEVVRLLKS